MERLDLLLVKLNFAPTRMKAQDLIKKGKVTVNGKIVSKASNKFSETDSISIDSEELIFVGRGAEKLKGAHLDFNLSFEGKIVGDMGASTGGFVEYSLLHGAKKVFAVDVGHDQLAEKLRGHDRVVNLEGVNIKNGFVLPELCDLIVGDLSFISLLQVLKPILSNLKPYGELALLVKPQFEVGKEFLGKNGIVKNQDAVIACLEKVYDEFQELGVCVEAAVPCSIAGKTGNQEYFFYGLYDSVLPSMAREKLGAMVKEAMTREKEK